MPLSSLLDSDELWRALAEQSPDHVMLLDLEGRIRYINHTVPDLDRDAVLGRVHTDFMPEGVRALAVDALHRSAQTRAAVTFQVEYLARDGEVRYFDVRVGPVLREGAVIGYISNSTDVTERLRAERLLRQTAEVHRLTFEHAPFGICHFDAASVVTACNGALARILGAPRERVVGVDMLRRMTNPEQLAALREALAGRVGVFEGPYTSVVGGGRSIIRTTYCPLTDEHGAPNGGIAVVEDMTELRAREAQLLNAQRLESLGLLAGGLAHDFNNLLTPVLLSVERLVDGTLEKRQAKTLAIVRRAVDRAGALTNQLLAFSRLQPLDLQPVDLTQQLAVTRSTLRRLLREDIALEVSLPEREAVIACDAPRLEQALFNLASNAQDAMPSGGTFCLALDHEPGAAPTGVTAAHGWVVMVISDTGVGMDAETAARAFDPFFSTKGRDRGTGLGLATVHGVVRQHGGWIETRSQRGVGTTFRIGLPALPAGTRRPRPSEHEPAPALGGSETILVVEDDADVRTLTSESLADLGYRVLQAESPEAALRLLAGEPGDVTLLISDVIMPGMSGPELFKRVASTRPGMRVLFISGYAEGMSTVAFPGRFLAKPFHRTALAHAVREALGRDAP